MPDWFSKAMEYCKPEQPPPTTPMRRPAGSGSWVAIISRTLLTALSVSRTGVEGAGGAASGVGVTVETVLVAMDLQISWGKPCARSVYRRGGQESPTD